MRSKFDERKDQRIADEVSTGYLPCMVCKRPTLRDTLEQYGAKCWECYRAWLGGGYVGDDSQPLTKADKLAILERCRASMAQWAERSRQVVAAAVSHEAEVTRDEILRREDVKRDLQRRVDERLGR